MNPPTVFLACPIGKPGSRERVRSEKLAQYIIEPTIRNLNYNLIPAHKIAEPGRITDQIAENLASSDIVITDLTGLNANVMYELGVRQALGLPCILMAQAGQTLPFDLLNFRTIFYGFEVGDAENAKSELRQQIEFALTRKGKIASANLYKRITVDEELQLTQKEVLDEILEKVRTLLSAQISTEFIGNFPNFLEQNIVNAILEAKKNILIACDFPAPGIFSAPDGFDKYLDALERRKIEAGLSVKFIVYSRKRRDDLNRLLIPESKEAWDILVSDKNKSFSKNLADFNSRHNTKINSPEELYEQFTLQDNVTIERLNRLTDEPVFEVDTLMPIYLWISDTCKAVFSIPTFPDIVNTSSTGKIETSYGFETTNGHLITSLERIWYWYKQTRLPHSTL